MKIPRHVKKIIKAKWGKKPVCQGCGSIMESIINLKPDEDAFTVVHKCKSCGWTSMSYTLLYLKKVKELVSNSSPFMIKTWWGKRYVCPKCCKGMKLIIRAESIDEDTVTVEYKCKHCGWAAMVTLNIVRERI